MQLTDTILATSSPPAGGGVRGILRLSGPDAWELARSLVDLPETLSAGWHGELAIPLVHPTAKLGAALLFKGPRSFTGQDIAEIHVPDSPAIMRVCIEAVLREGRGNARLAGPGEFSARAFFNGKIDLTRAEGIAATINAGNETQLRAAAALREGALYKQIAALTEQLANVLALVEAGIDFSDEEGVSFIQAERVKGALDRLTAWLDDLLHTAVRIDRLDSPPTVVLIGKANVGKSSLINLLAGGERAIVSDIAGTTRDILEATLHTPGGDVRILDVPGDEIPSDEMRSKMMEARRLAILEADLVIQVIDHTEDPRHAGEPMAREAPGSLFVLQNKSDLLTTAGSGDWDDAGDKPWGNVSAKTGLNIPRLRQLIAGLTARNQTLGQGRLVLNQRHRLILQDVKTTAKQAAALAADPQTFSRHPELVAADLRRSLDLLGQITGGVSPDEILGRIFSTFCIGK